MKIGEQIDHASVMQAEFVFYSVDIKQKLEKDQDLVIKVIPLDYQSDPDIFISKVSKSRFNILIDREVPNDTCG